jgi:hypothetical protein
MRRPDINDKIYQYRNGDFNSQLWEDHKTEYIDHVEAENKGLKVQMRSHIEAINELRKELEDANIKALSQAEQADEQKESKWISVEDRLPEKEKQVSIVVTGNNAQLGYRHERGYWIIYSLTGSYKNNYLHKVTHWQPLPDKPNN